MAADKIDTVTVLSDLARQVRGGTLELLRSTPPTWLTWAPPGASNHILWHAGHALAVQDVLCILPLIGRSELPTDWSKTFGQHCRPVATTKDWPTAQEIAGYLETQLDRFLQLLAEHAERIALHGHEVPSPGGWPLLAGIIHGWHDEARHQGEMYLLLKLCRAGAPP